MPDPYIVGAWMLGALNAVAAVLGFVQWLRNRPGQPFWALARAGQIAAAAYAILAGIYAVAVEAPADGLAWVYILTPVATSFFAEQLRLISAQTVIERHGYGSPAELRRKVERGDSEAQRMATGLANEVLLRETAILAAGAFVIAFLAWRAILLG